MATSNGKKNVSITAPASRRRSMGPRGQSLKAFTPDNYWDDEDEKCVHEENRVAGVDGATPDGAASPAPGAGWTNGQVPPQFTPAVTLHPYTRQGRLALYNHHRRWINFRSSWSRIGAGATEMDARHSASSGGASVLSGDRAEEAAAVRALVAQLCETFYRLGWATGTGGGVSVRVGGPDEGRPFRVFVAPSGVQKEDLVGDDIFELDMDQRVVAPPKTPGLRLSACTPLWYTVFRHRPAARCVIHTHSLHCAMATLLDPTERAPALRVTHLEMLKGVGNHAYDDVLEIPVIDNRPSEDLLADQMEAALQRYPKCNAVLVRRHGIYVWGDSWEQAKAQCESFDYLCESAVKMKAMGMDCALAPQGGTYHVEKGPLVRSKSEEADEEKKEDASPSPPLRKRPRVAPAFNAAGAQENAVDLVCAGATVPLVPRDARVLLLDIEGTTTSISFVKDVLFPYVTANLDDFLTGMAPQDLTQLRTALEADLAALGDDHPSHAAVAGENREATTPVSDQARAASCVRALMAQDVKATGLKSFQGEMWRAGYASGELVGHLYSDFVPTLQWCRAHDVAVHIYSSGSVGAQKLLFGHTAAGDLTAYFAGHFDTKIGSKREMASYRTIAGALGVAPEEVVFVSDLEAEIKAAHEAGMRAVAAVRPGNAPLGNEVKEKFPIVRSLLQLCGAD